jgi:uncharacterized membrane protein
MDEVVRRHPVRFEAVIVPPQSLTRRGLVVLGAAIAGGSAFMAGLAWAMGAWPVAGFSGLGVALAFLFLFLYRRRRAFHEILSLDEERLRIIRALGRGRREERSFDPYWVRVRLIERPGRTPALWLETRGAREEIGIWLGASAKRELAARLAEALRAWRNPEFDNPQLRLA